MPPENEQVIEPQEVSTALPAEANANPQQPDAVADPVASPSDEAKTTESPAPKTLLEAALSALGQSDEAPAAAALPAEQPQGETAPVLEPEEVASVEPDGLPQIPADEFKLLPKATKEAVKALRKEVKTLRPDADRGVAVSRFLQTTGVTPSEYGELLDVGALLKTNPAEARKVLLHHLDKVDTHLGLKIPEDISRDVDDGYLSQERAAELSQARARAQALEAAAEQQNVVSRQNAMLTDIAAWEAETSRTDADFARKLPMLQEKTRLAVLERQATGKSVSSGAEAIEIVRKAYEATNATLRAFAPAPAATRPTPTSAASAPAGRSAPRNLYEVAMQSVGLR